MDAGDFVGHVDARKEKITEDVCEEIIMGVANNKKLTGRGCGPPSA